MKAVVEEPAPTAKKRGRWDKTADGVAAVPAKKKAVAQTESAWEKEEVSELLLLVWAVVCVRVQAGL